MGSNETTPAETIKYWDYTVCCKVGVSKINYYFPDMYSRLQVSPRNDDVVNSVVDINLENLY